MTAAYSAEALPQEPGAAMLVVIGGKNIISFTAVYGLVPMVAIYSYMKTFMILGF